MCGFIVTWLKIYYYNQKSEIVNHNKLNNNNHFAKHAIHCNLSRSLHHFHEMKQNQAQTNNRPALCNHIACMYKTICVAALLTMIKRFFDSTILCIGIWYIYDIIPFMVSMFLIIVSNMLPFIGATMFLCSDYNVHGKHYV